MQYSHLDANGHSCNGSRRSGGVPFNAYNSSFDSMLYATNKWLLAREDSYEAKNKNAHIGLIGDLIRIE